MFTQCPQCQTAFRVTAPILEAAQGRVRCGHCGAVFNALSDFLHAKPILGEAAGTAEGVDGAADGTADEPANGPAETAFLSETPSQAAAGLPSDEELEEIFIEAYPQPPPSIAYADSDDAQASNDAEADADAADADRDIDSTAETAENEILDFDVQSAQAEEDITLEGVTISIVNEATGEYRTNFAVEAPDDPDFDSARTRSNAFERGTAHQPMGMAESALEEPLSPADFAAFRSKASAATAIELPPRSRALPWGLGATVLALTLIAQIVYFNREALARYPALGTSLRHLYGFFGIGLSPTWNLKAYEVRQWGAAAHSGSQGTLRVRASVFNTADYAQPYPLLRLMIEDRFGGRLGQRDLEPREYLPAPAAALGTDSTERLLGAGQRIDAQIAIIDPGKDAVGFQIDVCLRVAGNIVRCANDAEQTTS